MIAPFRPWRSANLGEAGRLALAPEPDRVGRRLAGREPGLVDRVVS